MPKRTRNYESDLQERLKNPAYAVEYLKAALQDEEGQGESVFLMALRDVAKANRIAHVAETTGLNRESIYKMLSEVGNPNFSSLKAILGAVGMKLSIELAAASESPIETVRESISVQPMFNVNSYATVILGAGVGLAGDLVQHLAHADIRTEFAFPSNQYCLNLGAANSELPLVASPESGTTRPAQNENQFAYAA